MSHLTSNIKKLPNNYELNFQVLQPFPQLQGRLLPRPVPVAIGFVHRVAGDDFLRRLAQLLRWLLLALVAGQQRSGYHHSLVPCEELSVGDTSHLVWRRHTLLPHHPGQSGADGCGRGHDLHLRNKIMAPVTGSLEVARKLDLFVSHLKNVDM